MVTVQKQEELSTVIGAYPLSSSLIPNEDQTELIEEEEEEEVELDSIVAKAMVGKPKEEIKLRKLMK